MTTLKVGIASYADMKARTIAIASGELKPHPDDPKVWCTSPESLAKLRHTLMLRLLAALIAILGATQAFAQPLWQSTVAGMSVEQVQAVVPGAASPRSSPETLKGGATELLRLDDFDLVGRKFSISFFFVDTRLTQVTISLEKGQSFSSAMLSFDALVEALRAKYGQELTREAKRGVLNVSSATWLSGQTNINLFAMSVRETNAVLNLNYQIRLAQEAKKL